MKRARCLVAAVVVAASVAACQTPPRTAARPAPSPPAAPAGLTLRAEGGRDVSPGLAPLPPDAAVAVGPKTVLAASNGRIELLDRAGGRIASGSPRDLFGSLLRPDELQTDPRAVFDPDSQRFFLVQTVFPLAWAGSKTPACPVNVPCHTGTLLAVSASAEPADLTAQSWHTYYATGWRPGQQEQPGITLDFPGLGISRRAVVITLLVLPAFGTGVRVIDKAAVLDGRPLQGWIDIDQPKDESGVALGLLQPAVTSGGDTLFLVGTSRLGPGQSADRDEDGQALEPDLVASSPLPPVEASRDPRCRITVAALTGPPAEPMLTARSLPAPAGCETIVGVEQPGGARPLEAGAFGLSSSPGVRDGQLWFAHSVTRDFGRGPAVAVHWGQVDVRRWPQQVSLVQESVLGTSGTSSFCAALAVTGAGQLVVAFAQSGPTEFPSVYFAGRDRGDPPGSLRAPVLVKAGVAAENLPPPRRNRYGDYFGAAVDPVDGSVWILGEYGQTGNEAGLWLGHVV